MVPGTPAVHKRSAPVLLLLSDAFPVLLLLSDAACFIAAVTREEQKQMQRAAGVASFGDINQLLSTAPRDVVELLRIAGAAMAHTSVTNLSTAAGVQFGCVGASTTCSCCC